MLKPKQKKILRGHANGLKPIFQIGKDGLSYNLIQGLEDGLEAHELVKIHVLNSCPDPLMELALDITRLTKSELVQIIGHNIVIYRRSKKGIYSLA